MTKSSAKLSLSSFRLRNVAMSGDPDLLLRGRLLRRLGLLREMLPGSFVEHKRACGDRTATVPTARTSIPNTRSRSSSAASPRLSTSRRLWSTNVGALSHDRKRIFDAVFLGASCQPAALHRIETECHSAARSKRIGSLSEDPSGYALERQDPSAISRIRL